MFDSLKEFFFGFLRSRHNSKRRGDDLENSEEPTLQHKKRRKCDSEYVNTDNSMTSQPSIFRSLESPEFIHQADWTHFPIPTQQANLQKRQSNISQISSQGYWQSSDFINNKENAMCDGDSPQISRSSNIPVFDIADDDENDDVEFEAPRRRQPVVKAWPAGIPNTAGMSRMPYSRSFNAPRMAGVRKSTGAYRKVLSVPDDSDDDIQELNSREMNSESSVLRFNSNPYSITRASAKSSRTSIPHWFQNKTRQKDPVVVSQEKLQFEQLINAFRNKSRASRVRPNIIPSLHCTAKRTSNLVKAKIPVVNVDTDNLVKDVVEVSSSYEVKPTTLATKIASHGLEVVANQPLMRRNSMEQMFCDSKYYNEMFLRRTNEKYDLQKKVSLEKAKIPQREADLRSLRSEKNKSHCDKILSQRLAVLELIVPDDEIEEIPKLPELSSEMRKVIHSALTATPRTKLLVDAFSLRIHHHDIVTLKAPNWLNDEVINFYMNLLIERGNDVKLPNVYAFNTFFYPRLLSGGHAALKRWTRKVDLFAQDLIIVPVHMGVHWCMASVNLPKQEICYYDSMGGSNDKCLSQLLGYLQKESEDKRKRPLSDGWKLINKKDIPQQTNGSDCGVFACMYSEYICRNAKITFTQDDMPYFREKMVYEILTKKLLPVS